MPPIPNGYVLIALIEAGSRESNAKLLRIGSRQLGTKYDWSPVGSTRCAQVPSPFVSTEIELRLFQQVMTS